MEQIQLRAEDLESGLLRLVEDEDGEVVAEDTAGVRYTIEGDPEDNPELTY